MIVNFELDNNVKIKLPDHELSTVMNQRRYSEPLFRKINTFLINNKLIDRNIVDLGCWIGDNSIPWALNCKSSTIYSIDPSKKNIDFIKSVCEINNIHNINTINKAVSGDVELLWTSDCIDHCSFVYNRDETKEKTELHSTTLDQLFLDGQISNIGYIHLDAEGMEYRILSGSKFLLSDMYPLITFEQHYLIDDVKSLLDTLLPIGYNVYIINEIMAGCRHDCRNFIAFPMNSSKINYKTSPSDIKNLFGNNSITKFDYESLK